MDRLAVAATAEAQYEAPAHVVARAKAIFEGHPQGIQGLTRILARLIYDSFRDPLPAGVRAGDRPSQALYEAEDFAVDLHINQERVGREQRTPRMVLVGQIADRKEPDRRLEDLPVLLMSGNRVAARGVSNHLGEFHLECGPAKRLKLQIPVDDQKAIEVPLRLGHGGGTAHGKALAFAAVTLCSLFWAGPSAQAGDRFVLRAGESDVADICRTHGLRCIEPLGRDEIWLVEGPDGVSPQQVEDQAVTDPRVLDFEPDERVRASTGIHPSGGIARDGSVDVGATEFAGDPAWVGYSRQPAGDLIGLPLLREEGQNGRGPIVAVIDTGVDPEHSLLKRSLVPGYDFTRDLAGTASEWPDLDQEVVVIVERKPIRLNQEVVVIVERKLTQEVVVIVELKQSEASVAGEETTLPLPAFFGHGTMVAGLVHLVAPEARIMPLKAFRADGTSQASDILRAIYYAVDNGAKVINMSFSSDSREIKRAIQYATSLGLICVSSAGNDGQETIVYPAAFKRVLGVASTTMLDERASFSNYGEKLVKLAAPGEKLVTTFPGEKYAQVSGTSFSTALVTGAAAVLAGVNSETDYRDAMEAFEHSQYISVDLGWGRIYIPDAVAALPVARRSHEEKESRETAEKDPQPQR